MWKKARNVRITYTPIAGTNPPQLDDVVSYQALGKPGLKTVKGVDKPFDVPNTAAPAAAAAVDQGDSVPASMAYAWRGKGWLMIASSKWEILGYGDEEGTGNSWVVTYFAKTLFTPAGVDFYSRKGTLKPETVENIKASLAGLGGDVVRLAGELFEVTKDGDMAD